MNQLKFAKQTLHLNNEAIIKQKQYLMKTLIPILALLIAAGSMNAQALLRPFEVISGKKTTYITKTDGSEVEGNVKKLPRKKGLIEEVKIEVSGKKIVIPGDKIKSAYFPQSNWDKMMKWDDFISDATQWKDGLHDADRIKEGYAIFETQDIQFKKKKLTLLLQLLNPGTCSRVKVYHNPYSAETASVGVGGMTLAGGNDKSYYVSKDGGTAFKLTKKNYKEEFAKLFGDCKATKATFGDAKWKEFEEALSQYNGSCEK